MNAASAPVIVTIDGPAGVGKSTLARRLAGALGVPYLDTGAMFRTVALRLADMPGGEPSAGALSGGPLPESLLRDGPELSRALAECEFSLQGQGEDTRLLCNGRPVGDEVRTERAGMLAAQVAGLAPVRDFLKQAQQALGVRFSLVAEGRDMGTVVFPAALCKIFLDARPEVRADRRCRQLREMGQPCDLRELTESIRQRDAQDRERAIAPLRPADDARIVDTSDKDIDVVFAELLQAVAEGKRRAELYRPIRRKDRAISPEQAAAILEKGEYGILSLVDNGLPYAVPLSYVLLDGAIYFHCALKGRKVDVLEACPEVCFTVVGETEPVYIKDFSTYYESAVVFGRCVRLAPGEERHRALLELAQKYLPDYMHRAEEDIRHSDSRTAVYKISLDLVTGKAKRKQPD